MQHGRSKSVVASRGSTRPSSPAPAPDDTIAPSQLSKGAEMAGSCSTSPNGPAFDDTIAAHRPDKSAA